jgi:hypothetical protein
LGRVGLGKSSHIKFALKVMRDVFGFVVHNFPNVGHSMQTLTKTFALYQLTHPKSKCRINFIDSPGLGGQGI